MKNLIDDVRRHTPKSVPGYNYIKTQSIYIPFKKVTIECLTRKISELNLFFESILKLIDISVKSINEIAAILGVSTSIVNEAIVDMVNIDYVFASEGMLTITEKGMKALETRKKVDIQKSYLKDLIVDLITGAVYNADSIKISKTGSRNVILEGVVNIDDAYLDTHFQEINNIYQLQQKNNSVFGNSAVTNELYKIIGVSYTELHYLESKVYIYKSDSSDELFFAFTNDSNDKYKNEFYNQLKDSFRPCQEYFFEKNRDLLDEIQKHKFVTEPTKLAQTQAITKLMFSDKPSEEELCADFVQDRYALNDSEYLSFLYNPKAFRYNGVYICTNYLGRLLSNTFCYQINVLAENIPIFVIYNKNEYRIEESLNHFFKSRGSNLYLIPQQTVCENVICFDSEILMYLHQNATPAFDRSITYLQLECTFNKQAVSDEINSIVNKYGLSAYLTEEKASHKTNTAKSRKKKKWQYR